METARRARGARTEIHKRSQWRAMVWQGRAVGVLTEWTGARERKQKPSVRVAREKRIGSSGAHTLITITRRSHGEAVFSHLTEKQNKSEMMSKRNAKVIRSASDYNSTRATRTDFSSTLRAGSAASRREWLAPAGTRLSGASVRRDSRRGESPAPFTFYDASRYTSDLPQPEGI